MPALKKNVKGIVAINNARAGERKLCQMSVLDLKFTSLSV